METSNIRHECELFRKKLMELNPNVMIDFSVFDPEEMAKDLKSGKTFAQAHTRAMQKVGK